MRNIRSSSKPMSLISLSAWIIFTIFIVTSILVISIGVMPPNFNDELYLLNNNFDLRLRSLDKSLSGYFNCRSPSDVYYDTDRALYEPQLEEIFEMFIPKSTPLKQAVNTLEVRAGGRCSTKKVDEDGKTETVCNFNKQRVHGFKTLSLRGWKIARAIKVTSEFQYVIQAKNESMIEIKAKLICGENYEINPSLYETSKIIQPLA